MEKQYLVKVEKHGLYGSRGVMERVVTESELKELINDGWIVISKDESY